METNASSRIAYYVMMNEADLDDMAALRQWTNLKIAFDAGQIWVSNFEEYQIDSVGVKSIPHKTIYYAKAGKLYPKNSLLPARNEPALLWTPIERALPIQLDDFNHNYFGTEERLAVKLVAIDTPKEAQVMLTSLDNLREFAETAPAIRLKPLEWVLMDNTDVLIFGQPVLPIKGSMFWVSHHAILPVGYDFEWTLLTAFIDKKINADKDHWVIWNQDATYFKIAKKAIRRLTLSSVRRTIKNI